MGIWVIADGIICQRPKFRPAHMYIPIIYVIGYAIFSYVYFLAGGTDWMGNHYIYNFMDWGTNATPIAGVVGLLSFIVIPVLYLAYGFLIGDSLHRFLGPLLNQNQANS